MDDVLGSILSIICGILVFSLMIWLYFILPRKMARKRGRSATGWMLIFWIISPIWGAILLNILGDSSEKIKQDVIEELRNNP